MSLDWLWRGVRVGDVRVSVRRFRRWAVVIALVVLVVNVLVGVLRPSEAVANHSATCGARVEGSYISETANGNYTALGVGLEETARLLGYTVTASGDRTVVIREQGSGVEHLRFVVTVNYHASRSAAGDGALLELAPGEGPEVVVAGSGSDRVNVHTTWVVIPTSEAEGCPHESSSFDEHQVELAATGTTLEPFVLAGGLGVFLLTGLVIRTFPRKRLPL